MVKANLKTVTKTGPIRKSLRLSERNRNIDDQSVKLVQNLAQNVYITKKITKVDPVISPTSKSTLVGRGLRSQKMEQHSSTKVIENGKNGKAKPRGRSQTIFEPKQLEPEHRSRRQNVRESCIVQKDGDGVNKSSTEGRVLRSRSQTVGPR